MSLKNQGILSSKVARSYKYSVISPLRIFLANLDDSSDSQSVDNLSKHSPLPPIVDDDLRNPNRDVPVLPVEEINARNASTGPEEEFLEIAPEPIVIPSDLLKEPPPLTASCVWWKCSSNTQTKCKNF